MRYDAITPLILQLLALPAGYLVGCVLTRFREGRRHG